MPDCSQCNRPLGRYRLRCASCGACDSCCDCEDGPDHTTFDAAELGLDPELDVLALDDVRRRIHEEE